MCSPALERTRSISLLARDKLHVAFGAATCRAARNIRQGEHCLGESSWSERAARPAHRCRRGELRIDYRRRIAGDAAPGSAPAVTIVTQY